MTDAPPHPAPAKTARMEGIDALRGLVMVIMALGHSRDFFSNSQAYFDPIDVHATSAAFFLTRWITDFCAPVFSFSAGLGVYISMSRGKPILYLHAASAAASCHGCTCIIPLGQSRLVLCQPARPELAS